MRFLSDFSSRSDLEKFGSNAIGLYAIDLRFQPEDLDALAVSALVDGTDDKKMDILLLDRGAGLLLVAQVYFRQNPLATDIAPANKAADLNTAMAWLLSVPIDSVPARIRKPVAEAREAVADGTVRSLFVWYIHNMSSSAQVAAELRAVEQSAAALVAQHFSDASIQEISAREVGASTLEEWYTASTSPILVNDMMTLDTEGGYVEAKADWEAFATAIPASWLYDLYQKHRSALFSANLRGYLGSRKSDSNINNGIQTTGAQDPAHFWVFNNGITALVHELKIERKPGNRTSLTIRGISIVNGAQTTGSIGALKARPSSDATVPARFILCADAKTIRSIITYNNSQNKLEAPDFRSNDAVQRRLREEFKHVRDAQYTGGRRGEREDDRRRNPNLVPAETVAQALAAFHGEPNIAYNEKSEIWISNKFYSQFFPDRLSARHVVLVYGLHKAIERMRLQLQSKLERTQEEEAQAMFLQGRGSSFLLANAVAACVETIVGQRIPDKFSMSFGDKCSPSEATELWEPVLQALIPLHAKLEPAVAARLSEATVREATRDFSASFASMKAIIGKALDALAAPFKAAIKVQ